MRNTFIDELISLAEHDSKIFLISGDLGYSVLEGFADRFPDRFINAGIAEQNMTQVAVGLALEGFNVFTYSIANFPTLRCIEQLRYDVAYHRANVKVVAVGSGYAYGPQGASHHATEDIAMMRAIPEFVICSPADPVEAKLAAKFMQNLSGPGYVRLNKSGEPNLHIREIKEENFKPGVFLKLRDGVDTVVLGTGVLVGKALADVEREGKNWGVYSVPFLGDYDLQEIQSLLNSYSRIITIEEHQSNGGFGASVLEKISDLYASEKINYMPKIIRVAIPNVFSQVAGSQDYLTNSIGLNLKNILDS